MKSNVYIIAGPNGAGKTTFAKQFLPLYAQCKHFVNADLIAQGVAPFAPQSAAIQAGRILLEQIHNLSEQKIDFAFETTLSGRTYIHFLKNLKSKGYTIYLFFLWVPSVSLALARIKERVASGGHNIPSQDVHRRFYKSIQNFLKEYKPLVDCWALIDNSQIPPDLIAQGVYGKVDILNHELYREISKLKE